VRQAQELHTTRTMKTVLFMRHAESEANVLGVCNDDPRMPLGLTALGRRQADATADELRGMPIGLVIVSELPRALETAKRVNRHHDAPLLVDARLNDRRTGFEGRSVAEYLAARDGDPLQFRAPGGESYGELKTRVLDLLAAIPRLDAQCVLVVSHHEVLQIVHGHFHGWSDRDILQFPLANAAVLRHVLPD
jgi:alpha-ribazole phosphatase